MIKSNVCCTTRASSQYLLFIRTNKTISARAPWTAPPVVMLRCWTIWLQKCILVEDTAKFTPIIALQYHWHYGRGGFAAVNPQTPYREKENQARGQLTVSGGATTPSSEWSCRVPNSDTRFSYLFPIPWPWLDIPCSPSCSMSTDSLLDVYLHGPRVMVAHPGCSLWAQGRLWPSAHGDSLMAWIFEEPSSIRLWGIFLFNSADFEPNPDRKGKKTSPQDLFYGPWVLTVACVRGCSPAICAHKQRGEISDSHLYWWPHTCSFHHCVSVSRNHNIVSGKSGFEYFLFEIICVSKMGFAQPVPVPQQRTELIFLSQKGCIQACMALWVQGGWNFFSAKWIFVYLETLM